LLNELSNSFDQIRYAEASICLSHNKNKGWKDKTPLQELSEHLDEIFNILFMVFEETKNDPLIAYQKTR